jgi:hypothetical protein
MSLSLSERSAVPLSAAVLALAVGTAPARAQNHASPAEIVTRVVEQATARAELAAARAQEAQARRRGPRDRQRIISSEIQVSRDEATLSLEMENGSESEFAIRDGHAWYDDDDLGAAARGGDLDRSWRELLAKAMDASSDDLPALLASWNPAGHPPLDQRLEEVLAGLADVPLANIAEAVAQAQTSAEQAERLSGDSVDRLVNRITELQRRVERLQSEDIPIRVRARSSRGGWFTTGPLRHLFRGLSGVISVAILFAVIFAIAFATIFFGGRRFIEGVADTARAATTRSLLVGVAASFLVIPAFVLGIIALAISIVGIPALIVWIPLFPVAVCLAILLGYIAVAHAAGESLAERRFYTADWFQRGNSYYFLISGLGLMLAPFIATNVVRMAGPWLGFLSGLLLAVGVVMTWAALSIGLGAVLLSRGGTRPVQGTSPVAEPEIYAETTGA